MEQVVCQRINDKAAAAYDRAVIKHNLSKDKLNRPDGYPKLKTTKKKKRTLISTNTTGYRGVSSRGKRFIGQIRINKQQTYLGIYATAKEAAVAYDRVVIKYNLSKDRLNFPNAKKTSSTSSEYDEEEDEDEIHV